MNRDKIENLKQIRERVENRRGKNGSRGSYLIPDPARKRGGITQFPLDSRKMEIEEEAAESTKELVERVLEVMNGSYELLKDCLVPAVVDEDMANELSEEGPTWPFLAGLHVVLYLDLTGIIREVTWTMALTWDQVDRWGIERQELLETAVRNIERKNYRVEQHTLSDSSGFGSEIVEAGFITLSSPKRLFPEYDTGLILSEAVLNDLMTVYGGPFYLYLTSTSGIYLSGGSEDPALTLHLIEAQNDYGGRLSDAVLFYDGKLSECKNTQQWF